ncbi:MAG: nucleoside 2-deoxyribosyltransferase [Microbacterium sp.]
MSLSRPVRLYLAGPEVFHQDGPAIAGRMRETCRAHGLEPVSPLDAGDEPIEGADIAADRPMDEVIFANNVAMIEHADAVVANMNHFRGPDPDAGSCWELGYGFGRGKRCYVFSDDGATAVERVESFYGPVTRDEASGRPLDADGIFVEDFGGPYNLMLTASSTVVFGDFEAAIARVAADVEAGLFD